MCCAVNSYINHSFFTFITVIVLCTIHFHPWLHQNHTSAPAPGNTDCKRNVGTCLSETSEVCPRADWLKYGQQPAELHWSVDRSMTRLFYCVSQSQAKSKHFEHLLWCVSLRYVTVMTFKAYTTAVMNKLTYVSFHKVGREQLSGEVVNFVAVSLQIY